MTRHYGDPHTWRSLLAAIGSVVAPVIAWLVFGVVVWWLAEGRWT